MPPPHPLYLILVLFCLYKSTNASSHGTNYASADCGARLLRTFPPTLEKAATVLTKDKDAYALGTCKPPTKTKINSNTKEEKRSTKDKEGEIKEDAYQSFTIELCDEILVNQVTLANFEFFSSQFHR